MNNITKIIRQKAPMQSIVKQVTLKDNLDKEQIINYLDKGGNINKTFTDSIGNNIGNFLFINQDKEVLIELINRGIDINCLDCQGRNCLWFIKENEIWELLISKGININQQTKKSYYEKNVLMDAVYTKNYDKAEILINHGINLNTKQITRNSILFQYPSDENLFNLIKDKDIEFENEITHILCLTNSIKIAKYLIEEKKIDVNATYKGMAASDMKVTALMSNFNPDICNLLISSGADVNSKDSLGRTALFYNAFKNYNKNIAWEYIYKKAEILLENDIDVNNKENSGENVLFYPLDRTLLQLYKKYNIDMECLDNNKNNAITKAHSIEKAELLYQYGSSIQKRFKQYEVPEIADWAKQINQQISQAKKEKHILEKTIKSKIEIKVKKRL